MTIHTILKMGDARLLRHAQTVTRFDTPELHQLVADLQDTCGQPTALAWLRHRSGSICRW